MVKHLLETSHPLSSSALHFCGPVPEPSPILRTHFQVPYPVSPLLATLTKTPGGCGGILPILVHPERLVRRELVPLSVQHFTTQIFLCVRVLPYLLTSLPPYLLPSFTSLPAARWTGGWRPGVIPILRKKRRGGPS